MNNNNDLPDDRLADYFRTGIEPVFSSRSWMDVVLIRDQRRRLGPFNTSRRCEHAP
jgi:hypothetical protein